MSDMDSDVDMDLDSSDEDNQLNELKQLTEALNAEDDSISLSTSRWARESNISAPVLTKITPNLDKLNKTESALAINNLYLETTRRLESLLFIRLRECREKLKVVQENIQNMSMYAKPESFKYISCGRPYFKDKLNFAAPDNEDAVLAKSEMYDFSLVVSVPGWTVRDKSNFVSEIHKMSQSVKKEELANKISQLKRVKPGSKETKQEIAKLEKEIEKVKKKPLSQLALPLNEEYDWDILANKLNRRHTAQEYQSLWKLFFHPSINKNSWSKTEHNALQKIASDQRHQDWDNIAKLLNTGRTGYQCFVYHRTNMTSALSGKRWTDDEVTYLRRLIDYFQEDNYIPWGKIAAAMENRTKIQIYNKYLRLIEQRKGRFLPEEDAVILNCQRRFGEDYKKMVNYLPGRSIVQIRSRFATLRKMRISTVWTIEDDRKLIQVMNNQDTVNFAEVTKYFAGKTRTNIRTRYVTLMKWMKKYPHLDLEHAPRRGARRLGHGQAQEDLNVAVEKLKNILSSEVEIKANKTRLSLESPEVDIEDAIIATLYTEKFQGDTKKNYESTSISEKPVAEQNLDVANLRKCLIFLNSHLDKKLYLSSKYRDIYHNLGNDEQDNCQVKVKSYSKRFITETIKIHGTPDVWGNVSLNAIRHVLPPHYANITGCKALMSHVSMNNRMCDTVDIHVLMRRNSFIKSQFQLLQDRFYTLFLWPMLLSNEGPVEFLNMKRNVNALNVRSPTIQHTPEVTIHQSWMKEYKCPETPSIDLEDDSDEDCSIYPGVYDTNYGNLK